MTTINYEKLARLALVTSTGWLAAFGCAPAEPAKKFESDVRPTERGAGGEDAGKPSSRPNPPGAIDGGTDAAGRNRIATGNAAWLFDGYCGTPELGACDAALDCPGAPDAIADDRCGFALERCAGPVLANGVRKRYLCVERGAPRWVFNGYCDGDPRAICTDDAKPPCADVALEGKECGADDGKCVVGSKIFVCVGTGNAWVTEGHCGGPVGDAPCSDLDSLEVCKSVYGGKECDPSDRKRCRSTSSSSSTGKVFACVSR